MSQAGNSLENHLVEQYAPSIQKLFNCTLSQEG